MAFLFFCGVSQWVFFSPLFCDGVIFLHGVIVLFCAFLCDNFFRSSYFIIL